MTIIPAQGTTRRYNEVTVVSGILDMTACTPDMTMIDAGFWSQHHTGTGDVVADTGGYHMSGGTGTAVLRTVSVEDTWDVTTRARGAWLTLTLRIDASNYFDVTATPTALTATSVSIPIVASFTASVAAGAVTPSSCT